MRRHRWSSLVVALLGCWIRGAQSDPGFTSLSSSEEYDYVVVGAGTAGSILAAKLATTHKRYKVLLLEAGPRTDVAGPLLSEAELKYFTVPGIWGQRCVYNTQLDCTTDWGFVTTTAPPRTGVHSTLWFGKNTGGSGTQNAMQYMHAARADFEVWSSFGPEYEKVWNPSAMSKAFKDMESAIPALQANSPHTYGTDGPIAVSAPLYKQPGFRDWYKEAWQQAGLPLVNDQNGPNDELGGRLGLAEDKFNIDANGRRSDTYTTCVLPLLHKSKHHDKRIKFTLITGATVNKIVFRDGSDPPVATGVRYTTMNGNEVHVKVRKEVVLSAGTVMSPTLLLQSGVGPADHLEAVGVPVVLDLPGVGTEVKDHSTFTINYLFKGGERIYIEDVINPEKFGANNELYFDHKHHHKGPLTSVAIPYTVYMRYPDYMEGEAGTIIPLGPNLEITPTATQGGPTPPGGCNSDPCTGFRTPVLLTQQKSPGGTIRLRSSDPQDRPIINLNYLSEDEDVQVMYQGLLKARSVIAQSALSERAYESYPQNRVTSYETFKELLVHGGMFRKGGHYFGGCTLGDVVDHKLRVKGLANVRVADASVIPQISTRPQGTIMLIGAVAADLILHHR
eukprot:TRINITY_DN29106_c0_g1_i1.p1 TRINITY_DN29106_c0_g1~~TRINITY_DN29106_c0_g1_i1.p1  ORF type:complete len:618 (+),score=83.18 TRINITY_DN29106_c0_g1_i1:100-1953(+)